MISSVDTYKTSLAEVVKKNTLNESNWRSEDWKKIWCEISQDVLDDAFNQHGVIKSLFSDVGTITPRNCKTLLRVQKKMTEQPPGRENYFKVVSDFAAVRIHCDVNEIPGKIDRIREIVLANGGQVHIRGSSNERSYGFVMSADKKYTDIVQYVYVFMEKVGYPIEFQIGHLFASHTFTIDSALRDNKNCGKVDLWDKNFYNDVKKYILDKANGVQPGSKEEIQAKAADLHQNHVPEELQLILNKL